MVLRATRGGNRLEIYLSLANENHLWLVRSPAGVTRGKLRFNSSDSLFRFD